MFYYFLCNSSDKEGTNNIVKQEKTKLGKFEMQLLAYAQLRKKEFISSGEIAAALDIKTEQEWKLLNRMATSGLIIRLKRGVYLVPSHMPVGGRWTVSGYYILSKLMEVLQRPIPNQRPHGLQLPWIRRPGPEPDLRLQ